MLYWVGDLDVIILIDWLLAITTYMLTLLSSETYQKLFDTSGRKHTAKQCIGHFIIRGGLVLRRTPKRASGLV